MKRTIYILAMLVTVSVWAQDKPKEVKQETETKTVTYDDGKSTSEKKVKVVTRETSGVKLDKEDRKKLNQDRVKTTKKVERMVMLDDDADSEFDILTKTTHFINDNKNYAFIPNGKGFDIAFDNDNNKFVKVGKAWSSRVKGNYIISGEIQNGIGYFDKHGDFVVEFYNENTNQIESITYNKDNS